MDGGFEASAPLVLHNIEELGFKPQDVKILLNTQAHFDHAGALAALKRATGAKLYALQAEARELANGGPDDGTPPIPPVSADVILEDGGEVELGGTVLTAHLTPGHTKGCTTFTTIIEGKSAGFVCSTTAPGYKLVGNAAYPNIVDDFRRTFKILGALPCDWFSPRTGPSSIWTASGRPFKPAAVARTRSSTPTAIAAFSPRPKRRSNGSSRSRSGFPKRAKSVRPPRMANLPPDLAELEKRFDALRGAL